MGIINVAPKILDPLPGGKFLVDAIDYVVNWARANSLWPLTYGTSCCAIEMMSSSMARYDIARFGSEVFRDSPRQADLFILAGTITKKMMPAVQMLWEQIPGPKYAIAMGACTISGGPFRYDNYSVVRGASEVIPVDVYIPGCPPRPEALFNGLLKLREKIMKETSRAPWREGALDFSGEKERWEESARAWKELEKIKDEEMARAREAFKENPPKDYQPYKPIRITKPAFPEIPYSKNPLENFSEETLSSLGESVKTQSNKNSNELTPKALFKIAQEKFPTIKFFDACEVEKSSENSSEEKDSLADKDFPINITVEKESYFELAKFLKEDSRLSLDYLIDITAIDWETHFEVVAFLGSTKFIHKVFLRLNLSKKDLPKEKAIKSILASAPSLTPLYPAAEFKEREVYDLFGISFENHPDMRRLFLDEDFEGFPLRKDFTHPHILKKPV